MSSPRRSDAAGVVLSIALACLVLPVLPGTRALAHGTLIPHDLAGVRLCSDDDSVQVSFEGDDDGLRTQLVRERLERAVRATLRAGGVPWRTEPACPAGRGYLAIGLHVRDASWFAPRASEYALEVRVGWRRTGDGPARADPPDAFDFAVVELYDERAVGVPAFVYLPRYVEAGLRDLAVSWWEDREPTAPVPPWVPALGGALALATGAASAWILRRRRQSRV